MYVLLTELVIGSTRSRFLQHPFAGGGTVRPSSARVTCNESTEATETNRTQTANIHTKRMQPKVTALTPRLAVMLTCFLYYWPPHALYLVVLLLLSWLTVAVPAVAVGAAAVGAVRW